MDLSQLQLPSWQAWWSPWAGNPLGVWMEDAQGYLTKLTFSLVAPHLLPNKLSLNNHPQCFQDQGSDWHMFLFLILLRNATGSLRATWAVTPTDQARHDEKAGGCYVGICKFCESLLCLFLYFQESSDLGLIFEPERAHMAPQIYTFKKIVIERVLFPVDHCNVIWIPKTLPFPGKTSPWSRLNSRGKGNENKKHTL